MSNSYNKNLIENIYTNIVKTSRNKCFFLEYEVEDTVEGRFDVIILHSFIIFHFFVEMGEKKSDLAQGLFDHMFLDFDNNLREMGFGDIAVNKRMKHFIRAFYGRISNYSMGIEDYNNNDNKLIRESIFNNVYKGKIKNDKYIDFWEKYLIDNINFFKDNTLKVNNDNLFQFKK